MREGRPMGLLAAGILPGGWVATAGLWSSLLAGGQGKGVAVIYNSRLPESKELAYYYAQRREVPTNQVFAFDLPATETMTRAEFRDQLQKPLLKALERQKLLTLRSEIIPATRERTGDAFQKVSESKIRYLTLCYGVPVKILKDPNLIEPGAERVRMEMRRNEAAVDSELAAFPMSQIAFYAGWYDGQFSGPFTRPKVEFMPGAVAYHLHSYSAHVLRTADHYWVGPLLAEGVTATLGYVEEPFLEWTVNVASFFGD